MDAITGCDCASCKHLIPQPKGMGEVAKLTTLKKRARLKKKSQQNANKMKLWNAADKENAFENIRKQTFSLHQKKMCAMQRTWIKRSKRKSWRVKGLVGAVVKQNIKWRNFIRIFYCFAVPLHNALTFFHVFPPPTTSTLYILFNATNLRKWSHKNYKVVERNTAQCIHVSVLNSNGFLTDVEKRGAKQTECTGEEGILIQFS